jgi:hypothetical protein
VRGKQKAVKKIEQQEIKLVPGQALDYIIISPQSSLSTSLPHPISYFS